jgi:hypothetical protein
MSYIIGGVVTVLLLAVIGCGAVTVHVFRTGTEDQQQGVRLVWFIVASWVFMFAMGYYVPQLITRLVALRPY